MEPPPDASAQSPGQSSAQSWQTSLPDPLPESLLRDLEDLAVSAARAAGRFIVQERPPRLGVLDTKSSVNDIVTVMDQQSEVLLRAHLLRARPDDAILGEEDGASAGSSGITWVIDPIDGTVNYLYEIPAFCVSVAAVIGDAATAGRWRPVAGAVFNPSTGEIFHARLGGGAYVRHADAGQPAAGQAAAGQAAEDRTITVNPVEVLLQSLVATGFGYLPQVRARQGAVVAALLPEIRDIRRAGSAALDLCAVACGTVDAYYESGLNAWDLAAGWVIATEAGALVTGLLDVDPGQGAVVAAGPGIHASLLSRLEALAPLR
jgi:myo-inositol-1(or 4)-monophosphatase